MQGAKEQAGTKYDDAPDHGSGASRLSFVAGAYSACSGSL